MGEMVLAKKIMLSEENAHVIIHWGHGVWLATRERENQDIIRTGPPSDRPARVTA
jgi:hypothetical protein